jgi:formate dehydrogenase maturation protein FdhE
MPQFFRCEVCSRESSSVAGWFVVLTNDGKRYLCCRGCLAKWAAEGRK